MDASTTQRSPGAPFEGSEAARDFIARLDSFFREELHPLAAEHGITHEKGAERPLLDQVWDHGSRSG